MKKVLRTAVMGLALVACVATPALRADDAVVEDSLKQVNDLWMYGTGGNMVDFFITFTLNVGTWLGW